MGSNQGRRGADERGRRGVGDPGGGSKCLCSDEAQRRVPCGQVGDPLAVILAEAARSGAVVILAADAEPGELPEGVARPTGRRGGQRIERREGPRDGGRVEQAPASDLQGGSSSAVERLFEDRRVLSLEHAGALPAIKRVLHSDGENAAFPRGGLGPTRSSGPGRVRPPPR